MPRHSPDYQRWQDDLVLIHLGQHPEGQTIRQVAQSVGITYTVAHEVLSRLRIAGSVELLGKVASKGQGAPSLLWKRVLQCPVFPSPQEVKEFQDE